MRTVRRSRTDHPTAAGKRKRRAREGKLEIRILEHLLRAGIRLDRPETPRQIADALNAPYATVTATLRRLARRGQIYHTYIVNNFATHFRHEYRVALSLDGREISRGDERRRKRLSSQSDGKKVSNGGPIERFVDELRINLAPDPNHFKHLVISDAVILHGATDRDIELTVMTDDGLYTLGRWVRDTLAGNPCIKSIHTITVGFRFGLHGYSGHDVTHRQKNGDAGVK